MNRLVPLVPFLLLVAGCGDAAPAPDAYGTFEATEVTVSSEAAGRLLRFDVREGETLDAGVIVGLIDTVQLDLQRRQAVAVRDAALARMSGVVAQTDVLREQLQTARRDLERIQRMAAKEAAPAQALDDATGRVAVLERQIEATRIQSAPIEAEVAAAEARIAQISDQIDRSIITNPVRGTVLTSFSEAHEVTTAGRPLYRIADLSGMWLRAYLSGSRLEPISIGDSVTVCFDGPDGRLDARGGTIGWIASEAEFTPRHIQTRDERVNLVYAVRVSVPNHDGRLRTGMPGELFLDRHDCRP